MEKRRSAWQPRRSIVDRSARAGGAVAPEVSGQLSRGAACNLEARGGRAHGRLIRQDQAHYLVCSAGTAPPPEAGTAPPPPAGRTRGQSRATGRGVRAPPGAARLRPVAALMPSGKGLSRRCLGSSPGSGIYWLWDLLSVTQTLRHLIVNLTLQVVSLTPS